MLASPSTASSWPYPHNTNVFTPSSSVRNATTASSGPFACGTSHAFGMGLSKRKNRDDGTGLGQMIDEVVNQNRPIQAAPKRLRMAQEPSSLLPAALDEQVQPAQPQARQISKAPGSAPSEPSWSSLRSYPAYAHTSLTSGRPPTIDEIHSWNSSDGHGSDASVEASSLAVSGRPTSVSSHATTVSSSSWIRVVTSYGHSFIRADEVDQLHSHNGFTHSPPRPATPSPVSSPILRTHGSPSLPGNAIFDIGGDNLVGEMVMDRAGRSDSIFNGGVGATYLGAVKSSGAGAGSLHTLSQNEWTPPATPPLALPTMSTAAHADAISAAVAVSLSGKGRAADSSVGSAGIDSAAMVPDPSSTGEAWPSDPSSSLWMNVQGDSEEGVCAPTLPSLLRPSHGRIGGYDAPYLRLSLSANSVGHPHPYNVTPPFTGPTVGFTLEEESAEAGDIAMDLS